MLACELELLVSHHSFTLFSFSFPNHDYAPKAICLSFDESGSTNCVRQVSIIAIITAFDSGWAIMMGSCGMALAPASHLHPSHLAPRLHRDLTTRRAHSSPVALSFSCPVLLRNVSVTTDICTVLRHVLKTQRFDHLHISTFSRISLSQSDFTLQQASQRTTRSRTSPRDSGITHSGQDTT